MGARIKGCDCDCATAPANPCEPCGAVGQFEIQCRSRGGSASLCGWGEFIPSSPPRYYLDANFGGSTSADRWGGSGATCGSGPEHSTYLMTGGGAKRWNPSGCTQSEDATLRLQLHIEFGGSSTDSDDTCPAGGPGQLAWGIENCSTISGLWLQSTTRTVQTSQAWSQGGPSVERECGCNGLTRVNCGGLTITLANEDTETTAMNRANPTWGEWGPVPGGCCTTTQAGRIARDFTFSQSEYRIRVAGVPNSIINIELFFTRSARGSFSIVRQFKPTQANFPTNPEEGWATFQVETGSGVTTCLVGAALYQP